jgi:hypothetical protein
VALQVEDALVERDAALRLPEIPEALVDALESLEKLGPVLDRVGSVVLLKRSLGLQLLEQLAVVVLKLRLL